MNPLKLFNKTNDLSVRGYAKGIEQKNQKTYDQNSKIFIGCMPKSGSTFVAKTISKILNYQYTGYFEQYGMASEQNLSEIKMIDCMDKQMIIHQHLLGSDENLFLLNRFRIRPVILVRNICDSLVSLREHIYNENRDWPFLFYINDSFFQKNEEEQYNFLIDFAVSWYINFYVSWYESIKSNKIEALMLTYEEMIEDKTRFLNKILNFYKQNVSTEEIRKVCGEMERSKDVRYSVGQKGRGEKKLKEYQKEKIREWAKYYTNIDFAPVGI